MLLKCQKCAHRCKVEPEFTGMTNEPKTAGINLGVAAPPVLLTGWHRQDTDALIVADSFNVHARVTG